MAHSIPCRFCCVTMAPAMPRAPPSARPTAAITLIERCMLSSPGGQTKTTLPMMGEQGLINFAAAAPHLVPIEAIGAFDAQAIGAVLIPAIPGGGGLKSLVWSCSQSSAEYGEHRQKAEARRRPCRPVSSMILQELHQPRLVVGRVPVFNRGSASARRVSARIA